MWIDNWNSVASDVTGWLAALDDSDHMPHGRLRLFEEYGREDNVTYNVTGVTAKSGYYEIDISFVDSDGSFQTDEDVIVSFVMAGDDGTSGSSGSPGTSGSSGS